MVHHHRIFVQHLLLRKGETEQQDTTAFHHLHPLPYSDYWSNRKTKLTLLRLFFLFSLLSFSFVFAPRILFFASSSFASEEDLLQLYNTSNHYRTREEVDPCSSVANNTICCDRTAFRTDVCFMRGDVRTHSPSNSILLVSSGDGNTTSTMEEKIRPYTRKWETSVMDTIDELRLKTTNLTDSCDVRHDVPAVFFSTGGYTGNVYHEFNDGIIPLYITSQHFNKQVVFVLLEYHDWWITKFANIISQLSDYPPIDYSNDRRTHCFSEAIVGLRIHDELAIDSARTTNNKTIGHFRQMLDEAYKPRVKYLLQDEEKISPQPLNPVNNTRNPKLVIISRNGSRGIENERELVKLAEDIGFRVEVLKPERTTELARIYQSLNSCDAMIGVHGAAMTHFLFMRPGSVFIQIVPLGTDWAAETYYGEPAVKMGLRYVRYGILPRESSLYREYRKDDPVLRDPESVNAKGWQVTKRVYLDGQNVRLDLVRFRKRLARAYQHVVSKKKRDS